MIWIIIISIIVICLLIWLVPSNFWKIFTLETEIESKVNVVEKDTIAVGSIGITLSRLAPGGTAIFGTEYYEVQSLKDFIDENTKIKVIKIEGSKILVIKEENS